MSPNASATDELVERLHRGQRYGQEPYINHLRRVARRLAGHGEHAYIAGLLHDSVEDTSMTLARLRSLGYPEIVVGAVEAVTCLPGEDYFDRIRIACAHPLGVHVKFAGNRDNFANVAVLAKVDPERAERLRDKYEAAREILYPAVLQWAREQAGVSFGPPMPSLGGVR